MILYRVHIQFPSLHLRKVYCLVNECGPKKLGGRGTFRHFYCKKSLRENGLKSLRVNPQQCPASATEAIEFKQPALLSLMPSATINHRPQSAVERIIVPLDVSSEAEAFDLIQKLPQVTFWKVGLELFVSTGATVVQQLKAEGKRVFLDLKLHDIPNTMAGACRAAGKYGVDLMTVHATAGPEALAAACLAVEQGAIAAGQAVPNLIAVTVLTSITGRSLSLNLKVSLELSDYALQMALMAQENGLSGCVCSPQEAALLRQCCGQNWLLVCPGVRPTWAQKGDQQRVMTPSQAVDSGATYLVIGRPITQSPDPADAFQRICEELSA